MIKQRNLKSIATVISGYNFRVALKAHEKGNNLVIQAKDVIENLYIREDNLTKIQFDNDKTSAFVKNDDVLMAVRGKFRGSLYTGKSQNIIASSSVYILRVIDEQVKPEYLAIYLNSKTGQREISKILTGAVVQSILRKDLENLRISIPDLEVQQKIIDVYKNNLSLQARLDTKKKIINNIAETAITRVLNN